MDVIDKFSNKFYNSADTNYTLRQIKKALHKNLQKKYRHLSETQILSNIDEIMNIHGLTTDQLNGLKFIQQLIKNKVNDISIDDNSNKEGNTIAGLFNEANAPMRKIVGYDLLYRTMKELYGKKRAKELIGELIDYSLGLSDSSNILLVYCWVLDGTKLNTIGRPFGMLQSAPCKRISSYISALVETIHQFSSHLAGACACLHKSQNLIIKQHKLVKLFNIKEFVNDNLDINNTRIFKNKQGEWEVCEIEHKDFFVLEDARRFVKVKKVYRRKYNDQIYTIETKSGKKVKCSKDHRFKVRERNRNIEVTASALEKNYQVYNALAFGLPIEFDTYEHSTGYNIGSLFAGEDTRSCVDDINIDMNGKSIEYMIGFLDGIFCNVLNNINNRFVNIKVNIANEIVIDKIVEICNLLNITNSGKIIEQSQTKTTCIVNLPNGILEYLPYTKEILSEKFDNLDKYKLNEDVIDYIINITTENNDDDYVYEIETESGWYSVNGIITHNCGSFFFDIAHLAILKMGITLDDVKTNNKCRKHFENEYQQLVHSVCHLSRNSSESPFSNLSIFDKVKIRSAIENDFSWYFQKPDDFEGDWITYCVDYIYELQQIFLNFFDKGDPLNGGLMYRFPVLTANLTKAKDDNGNSFVVDQEFLNNIVNRDIFKYNIFVSEGNKTASCCRLLSDSEMLEVANQSNSFGAGSLGSLGSHRVCTINYNRIALESTSIEEFWQIYDDRINSAKQVLIAHKTLLKVLTDAGLQMFIENHWISLNRLFSTFGILGIYECALTMQDKFGIDPTEFKIELLTYLNKLVVKFTEEEDGFIFNIEQIPGESFAVRLAKTDKLLYGDNNVPYHLYANQFVPLWEDANIFERLAEDGKYNQLITGGGIVHATIGEKVSPEQSKKIIEYAVSCECEHFALNPIYSQCKKGHIIFGDHTKCDICGSEINDKYTRIVGYLTPVSQWNPTRKKYDLPNRTKVQLENVNNK